jgi:hypothetical protein
MNRTRRPHTGVHWTHSCACLGIGAASRNSKCVDYTGGWPHGVDGCVGRLPRGAVMASPFGNDGTTTQLGVPVSALRNTSPPSMAIPVGGSGAVRAVLAGVGRAPWGVRDLVCGPIRLPVLRI